MRKNYPCRAARRVRRSSTGLRQPCDPSALGTTCRTIGCGSGQACRPGISPCVSRRRWFTLGSRPVERDCDGDARAGGHEQCRARRRESPRLERQRRGGCVRAGETVRKRRDPFAGHAEARGQSLGEPRDRCCRDEQVDLAEVERLRARQFADGRLSALERPSDVGLGDLDGEDVPAVTREPTRASSCQSTVALKQLRRTRGTWRTGTP